jgi:hypothetical protein
MDLKGIWIWNRHYNLSDSSAFEFDIVTTVGVKWEDDFLG